MSFLAIPGNECCHGNIFFLFLGLINKYFMVSLPFMPLHRLELISFSATAGNNCWQGDTFMLLGRKIFGGCGYKKY